jgi:DNA-binding MarR family transcriptional regulator
MLYYFFDQCIFLISQKRILMKEITKLVNEWDAFENEHPDSSIEDFCQYYIVRKKQQEVNNPIVAEGMLPVVEAALGRLFGRLNAINAWYFKHSTKRDRDIDLASFGLLNSVFLKKETQKSEAINNIFMEFSTGNDILARLKKKGLIEERSDPNDKRAKLVKLTSKGQKAVLSYRHDLAKIAQFMYGEMNNDEKKIILSLLSNIDLKHSELISENRSKDFRKLINGEKIT